jgi:predicted enzyme related to lactoylglutathione lyase
MKPKAKLVFVTMPVDDPKAVAAFYTKYIGVEFGRTFSDGVVSYHAPILEDGTQLSIQKRFSPHDMVTCYFAVDDIAETLRGMVCDGAKVAMEPIRLTVARDAIGGFIANSTVFFGIPAESVKDYLGLGAVVIDPAGNRIGLIQFEEFMHPMYSVGKFAKELTPAQANAHRISVEMGKLFDKIPAPKT